MNTKTKAVVIPALAVELLKLEIRSKSPLIVNYPKDIERKLLERQTKTAPKAKRAERDPEQEYLDSFYYFHDGVRTGFPAHGFKAAFVRAAKAMNMTMVDVRGALYIKADDPISGLIEIHGESMMRSDRVVIGKGSSDMRFRAQYPEWTATLHIEYNSGVLSAEQISLMCSLAGFQCGIGEWRPEKSNSGIYGRWEMVEG